MRDDADTPTPRSRAARAALRGLCVAPALALLALFAWTGVDAPLPDDLDALLRFANRSAEASTAGARASLLFQRYVDHRPVVTRLALLAEHALLGRVDFRMLAALGVAALLGLAWLVPRLRAPGSAPLPAVAALPVAWLLLQPQSYDALLSATAGANLLVLALAALALLSLRRGGAGGLAAGAAAALAAQFTQGNGVLVLPAGLAALWWAGRRREAGAWLAVAVPLAVVYAWGFTPRSGLTGLEPAQWGRTLAYALAFVGASPGLGHAAASVAAGAAIAGGLGVAARRCPPRDAPWWWGLALFALLSIAANAAGRGGLGADYVAGQSRYRVYSALLLVLLHLLVLAGLRDARVRRVYAGVAAAAAVAFGGLCWVQDAPRARALAESAARGLARWSVDGEGALHPRPRRADAILARSAALGTFAVRPDALARFLDRPVELALPAATGAVTLERVEMRGDDRFAVIEGLYRAGVADPEGLRVFSVVEGADAASVYTARRLAALRPGAPQGFRSVLPARALPADARGLGVLLEDGPQRALARTDR